MASAVLHRMTPSDPHPVTAVIFDLGRVIVDFDHFDISRKLSRYGAAAPEAIHDVVFNAELEQQFDLGLVTPHAFYTAVRNRFALDIDMAGFQDCWNTIFTLIPGIALLIRRLKKYRLVCLSNTNKWHFEYCRNHFPVLDLFDAFVLSYEAGLRKPDPGIFQLAVEAAGAPPQACLYIDDVPEFVHAASAEGIRGLVFRSVSALESELAALGAL